MLNEIRKDYKHETRMKFYRKKGIPKMELLKNKNTFRVSSSTYRNSLYKNTCTYVK